MKTLGLGASSRSTRRGAGEMCPYCGFSKVIFSVLFSFVPYWKGTHVYEGSIVFSSLFRVFSLVVVVWGYFGMSTLDMGAFWPSYYFFLY